jgi:hypothetical protein
MHDIAYMTSLNLAFSPLFYYASGSRDLKEIIYGTAAAAGLSVILGGPAGYALDMARDLTGIRKSERTFNIIRNRSSKTKNFLAILALAGCLASTVVIYGLTRDKNEIYQPKPAIEQIKENYQPKNLEQTLN